MKVLAIANHKGGCGKTTTSHNLAFCLADRGQRVLLVDMDPQSGLTGVCGMLSSEASLADVLGGANPGYLGIGSVLQKLEERVSLAPSRIELANNELGMVQRMGRESIFKRILEPMGSQFDIAIIDCAPSLGLLTVNALTAADKVICPTLPPAQDLRVLQAFLSNLETIQKELNPRLELLGILISLYESRLKQHQAALKALEETGLPVLPIKISRSVRISEASGKALPIIRQYPNHPQSDNYRQLAALVEEKLNLS
jgi:chromosome partitioning protein